MCVKMGATYLIYNEMYIVFAKTHLSSAALATAKGREHSGKKSTHADRIWYTLNIVHA